MCLSLEQLLIALHCRVSILHPSPSANFSRAARTPRPCEVQKWVMSLIFGACHDDNAQSHSRPLTMASHPDTKVDCSKVYVKRSSFSNEQTGDFDGAFAAVPFKKGKAACRVGDDWHFEHVRVLKYSLFHIHHTTHYLQVT